MESVSLYQLYTFTSLQVQHARRLCSQNCKNEARDILRFVRNAAICDILKLYTGPLKIDAHHLEWQLRDLEYECHPINPVDTQFEEKSLAKRIDLMAGQVASLTTVVIDLLKHVKSIPTAEGNAQSAPRTHSRFDTDLISLHDSAQPEFPSLEASLSGATGGFAGGAQG